MNELKLPVPTQEKVGRWVTWGLIGAAGVTAANFALPHLSTLAVNIADLARNTMYAVGMLVGLVLTIWLTLTFAPLLVQAVNVFARRSAWALVEMSPTIHLELALEEVQNDVQSFGNFIGQVEEVKAQTEERRDTASGKAQKAQNQYNAAMNMLQRPNIPEVQRIELEAAKGTASREHGMWMEAASKFDASVQRLDFQLTQNTRLFHVFKAEADSMKVDIEIQTQNWEQSKAEEGIMMLAEKLLFRKSQRQKYAEMAEQVITSRYAANIGRMRNVKRLAQDSFNKFDLQTGQYDAIAYQNWQSAMTQVIDNRTGQFEVVPVSRVQNAKPVF